MATPRAPVFLFNSKYPTGKAASPVTTSKFLPSKLICTGNLPARNASHNNNSTTILNDCINTSHCGGTNCNKRLPFFEKVINNTTGKGSNIATTGRGGSLLKSAKKFLSDK